MSDEKSLQTSGNEIISVNNLEVEPISQESNLASTAVHQEKSSQLKQQLLQVSQAKEAAEIEKWKAKIAQIAQLAEQQSQVDARVQMDLQTAKAPKSGRLRDLILSPTTVNFYEMLVTKKAQQQQTASTSKADKSNPAQENLFANNLSTNEGDANQKAA